MLVHRFFFAEKGFAVGTDFGGILRRVGFELRLATVATKAVGFAVKFNSLGFWIYRFA